MRAPTLFLIFLFCTLTATSQTKIFKNINLDAGSWRLFGIADENIKHSLNDTLGDFIISSKNDLKEIQKRWKLKKYYTDCNCSGNYSLYFRNSRGEEIVFWLDLNRKFIMEGTEGGSSYKFPRELFNSSFKHLRRIPKTIYIVDSLMSARRLIDKLRTIDTVYFRHNGYYIDEYDGSLFIQVPDSEILVDVEDRLKADYPNEKYELRHETSNDSTVTYEIRCNQSLAKDFKSWPIKKQWKPFSSIKFTIYNLTEEQVKEIIRNFKN